MFLLKKKRVEFLLGNFMFMLLAVFNYCKFSGRSKSPKILQLLKKATKTKSKLRTPDFLKQPYMLQKQTF